MKLQKVGGLWHELAVNKGQTQCGKPHKDYADAKEAYNCVIPCGDWEGGEVISWNLKKKVELKQGQALEELKDHGILWIYLFMQV